MDGHPFEYEQRDCLLGTSCSIRRGAARLVLLTRTSAESSVGGREMLHVRAYGTGVPGSNVPCGEPQSIVDIDAAVQRTSEHCCEVAAFVKVRTFL